ncbi:hypothetical protein [Collimonas pratensis]|uniref:hypothetical protein n=1 Tax=Collimonas pratensis TaxID=279113 RepID=UPI000783EDCF|nr:hypothetical protein [Collimonas pratensis]
MKHFLWLWVISTIGVFVGIVASNFLADEIISALKINDAMQPLMYVAFFLHSITNIIEWPAAQLVHMYTEDWIVAMLVAACCVLWGTLVAYVLSRIKSR